MAVSGTSAGPALAQTTAADDYPQRPVRVLAPGQPGGTTDYLARVVATRLAERLGQTVVVENRTGAGTVVALNAVARSAPDGYTLGITFTPHTVTPAMQDRLPYDPIADFAPVMLLTTAPLVLVVPANSPITGVQSLVAAGRTRTLSYGSAGIGSGGHLAGALLQNAAGMQATHVPYKGAAPAASDLLAGHLDFQFGSQITVQGFVQNGRLRALAVTSPERAPSLPGLPTVAESGYAGFEVLNWFGLVAPAKTPPAIVARLNRELRAALAVEATREALTRDGSQIAASTPAAFGAFMQADLAKWSRLARALGLKAD